MFQADSVRLETDSGGVPRLDVGDIYLVGSADIPDQFPRIVSDGLSGDGLAWPALPALDQALAPFVASGAVPDPSATPAPTFGEDSADPAATPAPSDPAEPSPAASADADGDSLAVIPLGGDGGPLDRFGEDPVGNGVSVVVLLLLGVSLVAAPLLAMRGSLPRFPGWLVSVLVLVGIVVAAYLATVETTGSEAVCGPVGDCNAVQQSEYAQLFGVHVGVLGVLGYLLIGILWVVSRVAKGVLADWSLVLIALGSLFGVAFSTYLTFLEPFVIGATCMWCITSALVMLGLLWVSAGPGWAAWQRLRDASDGGRHATAGA
jgi:uncharacterized membrane protein